MIPSGLYLADTSAIARIAYGPVRTELYRLGRLGLLASCITVDLEVLNSARSPSEYEAIARARDAGFVALPLRPEIASRARAVQSALAARSRHRSAGVIDLLTAAIAEHYAAMVLHYDRDFDHIAEVTGQPVRWVVPAGTAS